jgi:hypothetical protein
MCTLNPTLDPTEVQLTKKYSCEICDYKCCSKSDMNKHFKTIKHTNNTKLPYESLTQYISKKHHCICGKKYAYQQGLSVHKKTCSKLISPPICTTNEQKQQLFTDEMVMELIKQNKELQTLLLEQQKMVMEQSNKICSFMQIPSNNNTNL